MFSFLEFLNSGLWNFLLLFLGKKLILTSPFMILSVLVQDFPELSGSLSVVHNLLDMQIKLSSQEPKYNHFESVHKKKPLSSDIQLLFWLYSWLLLMQLLRVVRFQITEQAFNSLYINKFIHHGVHCSVISFFRCIIRILTVVYFIVVAFRHVLHTQEVRLQIKRFQKAKSQ